MRDAKPERPKQCGFEIASFRIDWTKPLPQIESEAVEWLRVNSRCKDVKPKRGRHAREQAQHKDALRGLGASRLLARYSVQEAMKMVSDCGVKYPYTTYPGHQTAWKTGAKGVAKILRDTYSLKKTEMPLSWQQWQKRQKRHKQK